jgi:hypothetical protein
VARRYSKGASACRRAGRRVATGRVDRPAALAQVATASYTLSWPAADGRFWLREETDAYLTVDRDDKGGVQALTLVRNGDSFRMTPLPKPAPPEPPEQSVEELEAARLGALGADKADGVKTIRLTGTMSFRQSGITGSYVLVAQGPDRLRIDYDVGPFGRATTVVAGRSGWQENHFAGFKVLGAPECAGFLLRNPFVETELTDHSEECGDREGARPAGARRRRAFERRGAGHDRVHAAEVVPGSRTLAREAGRRRTIDIYVSTARRRRRSKARPSPASQLAALRVTLKDAGNGEGRRPAKAASRRSTRAPDRQGRADVSFRPRSRSGKRARTRSRDRDARARQRSSPRRSWPHAAVAASPSVRRRVATRPSARARLTSATTRASSGGEKSIPSTRFHGMKLT